MPKINLTDATVRALSAPDGGRVEIADARSRGLYLRITAGGVKTWCFRYRDRVTGKTERRTLGRYPDIGLARARELADSNRVTVSLGQSPQAQLRDKRVAERRALSFDALVDRYLKEEVCRTKKASTAAVERSHLKAAQSAWSGRKAKDISRGDVREFLDERAKSAPIGANRTLVVLSAMFGWAVEQGHLETSPIIKIRRPTKTERPRDRVLNRSEIALLWQAFDTLDTRLATALRVALATGQRPGQVVSMELDELQDLATPGSATWHIPLRKRKDPRGTKRGPHIVPLSSFAVDLIRTALDQRSAGDESPWVFGSFRAPGSAIDRHSLSRALQRLILNLPFEGPDAATSKRLRDERPTPHDFRRTVATQLSALGIPREDRLAVLDHAEGDVHDTHYDRYDRLKEKREALDLWTHLLRTTVGRTGVEAIETPFVKAGASA